MNFNLKKIPFTLVCCCLMTIWAVAFLLWGGLSLEYDDGGFGSVVYGLVFIISLPFQIVRPPVFGFFVGVACFISLDLLLAWFRYARSKGIF